MFRSVHHQLLSFDLEWIPDPLSAHLLCGLAADRPYEEAFAALWQAAGATPENPRPYLKTFLCRIVSVAGIFRDATGSNVDLKLFSRPQELDSAEATSEAHILKQLLKAISRKKPQIVGFNSTQADLQILVQRSIVHGISGLDFAKRPEKPWDGADYFSSASDYHIDLATLLGRFRDMPTLHEAAVLSGIPGKLDVEGASVPEMWLSGRLPEIVAYNECDAFTTHLLWARMAHFTGHLDDAAYAQETRLVRALLEEEVAKGRSHLQRFIDEWDRLQNLIAHRG